MATLVRETPFCSWNLRPNSTVGAPSTRGLESGQEALERSAALLLQLFRSPDRGEYAGSRGLRLFEDTVYLFSSWLHTEIHFIVALNQECIRFRAVRDPVDDLLARDAVGKLVDPARELGLGGRPADLEQIDRSSAIVGSWGYRPRP